MQLQNNKQLRIVHLLTSGNVGGIEVLCRNIGSNSKNEHVFVFAFGEGLVFQDMQEKGLLVKSYAQYRKFSLKRLVLLCKDIKKADAIIVHHNDPNLESYYLLLKLLFPHKRYLTMVHHCYDSNEDLEQYGRIKKNIKDLITSWMFRISDECIFVSKAGYKSYKNNYRINKRKVRIIYNGISKEILIAGNEAKKTKKDSPLIIYAGRLEKIKGVDLLIKALGLLEDREYRLIVIGDGSQRFKLEQLSKDMLVNAEFVGFQKDVKPWLESADIFVYPSRSEVFGLSLVEAMAFKCVCVANNVGGIPEIIKDGQNGLLNIDNTVEGLAETIKKAIGICNDTSVREDVMTSARKTAERFNILKTVYCLEKEVKSGGK